MKTVKNILKSFIRRGRYIEEEGKKNFFGNYSCYFDCCHACSHGADHSGDFWINNVGVLGRERGREVLSGPSFDRGEERL